MKLTLKIEKDTNIDCHDLIDTITSQLKDLRYGMVEKRDSHVTFKDFDKHGMAALRVDAFSKADSGTFEIIEFEHRRRVKLTYFMSITEEVILIPSLVLIGPFYDFYPCFGAALFLSSSYSGYFLQKQNGKRR